MNPTQTLLSIKQLEILYPSLDGHGYTNAVKGLNLDLQQGEIGCLLGSSGCGKSTVLRAICGFEPAKSGEIHLRNKVVSSPSSHIPPNQRRVGMVFQDFALFPHLNVLENIAFGLQHLSKQEGVVLAKEWLKRVSLADKASAYPHELSGGQQQRVALARAMAPEPDLILLDEPTSALDPISTGKIEELINELKAEYTIAIVTHNMQQAARVSDYTAYMYLGVLVEYGKTDEIFIKPKCKETEDYITGRFG